MSRWLRYTLVVIVTLLVIGIFGVVIHSANSKIFEQYFSILLMLNVGMVALLGLVVLTLVVRLVRRLRQNIYGTRMTLRLAVTSGLIGLIPATTIYLLSTEIVGRSIDSWFDTRVEGALDSGLTITRGVLQNMQNSTEVEADRIAKILSNTPPSLMVSELSRLIEEKGDLEALVFTAGGQAIASAGSKLHVLLPNIPTHLQIQTAATTGSYSSVDTETLDKTDPNGTKTTDMNVRVIVAIPTPKMPPLRLDGGLAINHSEASQRLFLQIIRPVPQSIATNASRLLDGYREYQEMTLSRASLTNLYKLTLSLTLLLTIFVSMMAALRFAKRTTEPVLQLASGTRKVATGNFEPIREFSGNSEINELTRSFNTMIEELKDANGKLQTQRARAQEAQRFLARILTSISSGVMVLNEDGVILSFNAAAQRILSAHPLVEGALLKDFEPELAHMIEHKQRGFNDLTDSFKKEIELRHEAVTVPLYVQGTPMLIENEMAVVIVFDDLTQLIRAQRVTAWGEVARRLAHEIKNPLTPIRLAAERLAWKLDGKLATEQDQALLTRTISTITLQVDALTQMVNDFREYAKLPEAKLAPIDLNDFIRSTVALYHEGGIAIDLALESPLPPILGDIAQLRQVLHNLISNSIEASDDLQAVRIRIETQVVGGINAPNTATAVKLSLTDNGPGFDKAVLASAFEPYVTTKPTGSGLGLPMVKKILDEHEATIRLGNLTDESDQHVVGASVTMLFRAVK